MRVVLIGASEIGVHAARLLIDRGHDVGLVGRSLGFERVVTSIANPAYEAICRELGLDDTVVPSRTIARYLADTVGGTDVIELSTVTKGEARTLTFPARTRSPCASSTCPSGPAWSVCIGMESSASWMMTTRSRRATRSSS